MRKIITIVSILMIISGASNAQVDKRVMGEDDRFPDLDSLRLGSFGKVTVYAHSHLNYLLNRYGSTMNKAEGIPGWRIQIFFGSGHGAADRARNTQKAFEEKYNLNAYLIYQSPYFKVRVGDFRLHNKSAAIRTKHKIISDYPNCWIVEDLVQPQSQLNANNF